jgi:hypothetical protein
MDDNTIQGVIYMKKMLMALSALVCLPLSSGEVFAYTTCPHVFAGGGSLVAQSTGYSGYGFNKDTMIYPASCSGASVTFQFNVNTSECPYIGFGWKYNDNTLEFSLTDWRYGSVRATSSSPNRLHYVSNPGGWNEITLWSSTTTNTDAAISASCGYSGDDAMTKAYNAAAAQSM